MTVRCQKHVVPRVVKSRGRTQRLEGQGLGGLWEDGHCLIGRVLQFRKPESTLQKTVVMFA